jgi:hypothetical protein
MLEDLLHISAVGVENAALLSLDTTLLGRKSEIAALRWTNISYHPEYKCLIVMKYQYKYQSRGYETLPEPAGCIHTWPN